MSHPSLVLRDVRLGAGGPVGDVLIADGLIHSVGPRVEHTPAHRILSAADLTVLPGLVDAHVHLTQWALARRRVDVSPAGSPEELVELVVEHLDGGSRPHAGLVTAYGFRSATWQRQPDGAAFERALPGQPVLAISNDLHTACASPAASSALDLDLPPSGVVREAEALELMARLADVPVELGDQWALEALDAAAGRGVTGLVDFEVADNLAVWARRAKLARRLPVHVVATIYPEYLDAAIAAGRRTGDHIEGTEGRVSVGPLKVFVDGSLNARTALCHAPFVGTDGHGLLVTPEPMLHDLMARAHRANISAAIHAIGDRAASLTLDAFAEIGCNGRIEHAQLMRPRDIRRMAELHLVAGIQPRHALDDRSVTEQLWGDRLPDAFPHGALVRSGVPVEIGSDAPVSPLDPWLGIAAAVHRCLDSEAPWRPEQRIPVADALAAAAGGMRALRVGDVANLVVIRGDPARMTPTELAAPEVVATMAGGRTTWFDGASAADAEPVRSQRTY